MCVCANLMCGHVYTSTGAHGVLKNGLDNLELEVEVGASILTWVLRVELSHRKGNVCW